MFINIFLSLVFVLEVSLLKVYIDSSNLIGDLNRFWTSTGLCGPLEPNDTIKFMLSKDEKFNLAYLSAVPNNGITHIRIHWLFNLITATPESTYNYTYLDTVLDWMTIHNLMPGFEIMGNPSGIFTDLNNKTQLKSWGRLVRKTIKRYKEKYGIEIISRWRFETWNEPDLRGYNIVNFNLNGYIDYVNVCARSLRKVGGTSLRLGGPAGLFKAPIHHPLCWGMLHYCAAGHCPLNYISFHKKGNASASDVVNQGVELINYIHEEFPELKSLPVANDESDPLSGWSKNESWRADTRYAAMVVAIILGHQEQFVRQRNIKLEVISNDNGFMNYHPFYFSQRTLLTRFQMNNTSPHHLQFVKKPVYVAMALLSFLCDKELPLSYDIVDPYINSLASRTEFNTNSIRAAVIISYSNNSYSDELYIKNVTVVLKNITAFDNTKYLIYTLNNLVTNPSQIWNDWNSPVFPNKTVREAMRNVEGPFVSQPLTSVSTREELTITASLRLPSVTLIHVCGGEHVSPGAVSRLQVYNVTYNEVLLFWSDAQVMSKCIKTYEVQFRSETSNKLKFERINNEDIIFLTFQYVVFKDNIGTEMTRGWYRVRGLDYWGRAGPYSNVVKYSTRR